jgi:uncharacterized protein (TIGR02246 family)
MHDIEIRRLYQSIIDRWNARDAAGFGALFTEEGQCVGFDGSELDGRREIDASLTAIFTHHPTAPYVTKVRWVRPLGPDAALLRAVAGMIPPGQADLNPALNAIQTLVAVKRDMVWAAVLFQNTPAAFHGRPDVSAALTNELRALIPRA